MTGQEFKNHMIDEELTIYQAGTIRDELKNLIAEHDSIKLDLKNIERCDTAGIQLLYSAKITAEKLNRQLVFVNPSECLMELVNQTGMDSELTFI